MNILQEGVFSEGGSLPYESELIQQIANDLSQLEGSYFVKRIVCKKRVFFFIYIK